MLSGSWVQRFKKNLANMKKYKKLLKFSNRKQLLNTSIAIPIFIKFVFIYQICMQQIIE